MSDNGYLSRFQKILFSPDVPALYGQGLSDYEIIVRLLKKIVDCEDKITNFEDLAKKLEDILSDLDGTVKKEVIDYVKELYETGELAEIIGNVIANSIQDKHGDIDLSHMGYVLHKAHNYGLSELPAEDATLTIREELFSALQGNCVFEINGNMFWACLYVCQNGYTEAERNNACRIYIYTINQDNSLSYVTDREFAVVGHGNSMTYLNGYLYISPNSYAGTGGGTTTDIKRISFDGEQLGGIWNVELQKYTPESKTPTGWIYSTPFADNICAYDDKLYIFDSVMNMYTYDWDSNIVTLIDERINGITGRTGLADGLSITNDYIYFSAVGYRIKRYNRHLKYVDWVYQLPIKCNNKAYKLGEVEGFTIFNGILYLAGFYNLCGVSTSYNTYSITHFYCQNLATNDIAIKNVVNWSNGYVIENAIFTIEGNLPSDTMNSINDYFKCPCVQAALDFFETNEYLNRCIISPRQYRNLSTIDIRTTKPVTIDGTYYRNNINKDVSPTIGHIYTASNSSVYLININICNRLPIDINNTNITNNCVASLGGTISVQNCSFPTGLITNSSNVLYAILAYHGTLNVRTDAAYSTNPGTWIAQRMAIGVNNAAYTAGSDIIRNINQDVTGN